MIEFTNYRKRIKIDLEPGIWVFDTQSATGKTYLCKCLKDLELLGEQVCSYTYDDVLLGKDLHSALSCGKYKVIMLDRYDMYSSVEHEAICECAKDAIVLIDCKRGFRGSMNDRMCFITISDDMIEVEP